MLNQGFGIVTAFFKYLNNDEHCITSNTQGRLCCSLGHTFKKENRFSMSLINL